jgi:hypothetical protein
VRCISPQGPGDGRLADRGVLHLYAMERADFVASANRGDPGKSTRLDEARSGSLHTSRHPNCWHLSGKLNPKSDLFGDVASLNAPHIAVLRRRDPQRPHR